MAKGGGKKGKGGKGRTKPKPGGKKDGRIKRK